MRVRKLSSPPPSNRLVRTVLVATAVVLAPLAADAHDVAMPNTQIRKEVQRLKDTLDFYRTRPAIPPLPESEADQRRILGAAEIERALGNEDRALEMLMGRLADPNFTKLPEYVDTLLLTSEILASNAEDIGAMHYAELALKAGGTPEQMAEAGGRWFHLARRNERLDRRLELYDLWRHRGGENAAGTETAAKVMYEVGFALRADRKLTEARALLATVPSDSAFGSRAAYLAGVVFVEEGDLENAERWFGAVMDWALPAKLPERQQKIERQVRDLAALSAGRLRWERGDLEAADAAYKRIPDGSEHQREACWERAHLDVARGSRRGALKRSQCVVDLGARGTRQVDARLFQASLLAHMNRYADSVASYEHLHQRVKQERDLYANAIVEIADPAEFLFTAMERNVGLSDEPSPGPATLFADAWTPNVDQAYRIDRGVRFAKDEVWTMVDEIDALTRSLTADKAFVGLELRRQNLETLLRDVRHLESHAGGTEEMLRRHQRHASSDGEVQIDHTHAAQAEEVGQMIEQLRAMARAVEGEILLVEYEEDSRRKQAQTMLTSIRAEVVDIMKALAALESESKPTTVAVAKDALGDVKASLDDAAMRAEYGVLDTYWLKKQHRTQAIEAILGQQEETERQVLEALEGLAKEEAAAQ